MKNFFGKIKDFFFKIKIPRFFKTKKFIIIVSVFILFFLFTPISLHQVGNQIESFINAKAKTGVQKFEKQTGLQIQWERLDFNIFTMTARLEGVQVIPLKTSAFQKIQELRFLDGLQKVGEISARPSLYSLLVKKEIFLSKLKIKDGNIYLKTLKYFLKNPTPAQNIALPIRKIVVRDTNLNLRHEDHEFQLSDIQSSVAQKRAGVFHFKLFVEAFRIRQNLGFKGFHNTGTALSEKNILGSSIESQVYQFSFRGLAQKGKLFFKDINLKNENFQSLTEWLDIHFSSKGLKQVSVKSSGSLPFSLIQKGIDLAGGKPLSFSSLLFYKMNVQYIERKGYQGFFEVQGESSVFKTTHLKKFFFKGKLSNNVVVLNEGLLETEKQGTAIFKKGELIFKGSAPKFSFSADTKKLSSEFVTQNILGFDSFPVHGELTGSLRCEGNTQGMYVKCSIQGQSRQVKVRPGEDEILSFYGMSLKSKLEWNGQFLDFIVTGKKKDSSKLELKGRYSKALNRLDSSYFFFGNLKEDLKFNTPFPLEGPAQIQRGRMLIGKNRVELEGAFSSSLLEIQSYKLKNISGLYKLKNTQLDFFNVKGTPDRTNYKAKLGIDFKEKKVLLKAEASFFDVENLQEAVQDNVSWPVELKGTGVASFSMLFPWSQPEKREFRFKGDLFNVFIDQDFFQQVTLDFGIRNQSGVVHSLFLKKGQGFVRGSGFFDNDYSLDLDIIGQKLPLEKLERLNTILPFNQSGDVNFSMKVTGPLNNLKIQSDVLIDSMFVYSYPVQNSKIKLSIDKKALSFSGRIMNKIKIDKFVYPFSDRSKIEALGQFTDLDFVKMFFSKNRVDRAQDYVSQATGSFSFSKVKDIKKPWIGKFNIDDFFISKSDKWIKNENPFAISFARKKLSLTPVRFLHHKNQKLVIEKRSEDKLFLSGESFLGLFSGFFPFLKDLEGNIKGQVLIDNNLKKLHPKGSLQIAGGRLSIKTLPEFTNVKTSLIFSRNNIFVNNFTAEAGGGSVNGGGSISYDFLNPPAVNVKLDFSNVYFDLPKDFNTRGSGKVRIQGRKKPYLIAGQYAISSGSITRDFSDRSKQMKYDFNFLNKEIEKQDSIFELNLNIRTQQPVAVRSSLIRSSVEGGIDVYGPLLSPLINGQISFSQKTEENSIFFRGQEFKISSGSILFKNSEPDNPYLNIKADTLFTEQVVDPLESRQKIEKQYKIFLSLKGPSRNPVFSLNSSPSLDEKEIISLLTLGVGSRRFDANVKHSVADYSYQIVGSMLLEKSLNKEIKDALGMDFRLTPYINTLNKPVTKITLSRNWFKKWRTSFSQTIEDQERDVRLKYTLNPGVSLTAFWENTRQEDSENSFDERMGLDFEFNFDF